MSSPDAIPSRGDDVVAPICPRDSRSAAPPPDHRGGRPFTDDLDALEARR
jgi:hypothetical protein